MSKQQKKADYFVRINKYFAEYSKIFLVFADNVGSTQMHEIRRALRGDASVLMGKNTLIRKAITGLLDERPELEVLLPYIKGNVGLVFTNGDLKAMREKIISNRVKAPARAGGLAPLDVFVPAGNTGMDPGKTSFYQALGIPTKIARGTIEIINDVHLVKVGEKVGQSEATLLNMLNISPFTFGLVVTQVYDNGVVFDQKILDVEDEQLIKTFTGCIQDIAAISLSLNIPTMASVSHSIVNAYKNILAVSVASEYTFDGSEKIKDMLANPEAYAAAAPVAVAAADSKADSKAPAAKAVEEEEEEDDDMGFGLFD